MSASPKASKQPRHSATAKNHHDKKERRKQPKKQSAQTFETTMTETREAMPRYQRTFSKIIHTKAISLLSDLLGGSILRPNALLLGGILAFSFTLVAYLLAKNLGYTLSGFEFVGGFTVGWLLGLAYDLFRRIFRRKDT